jgi:hypothetical protein
MKSSLQKLYFIALSLGLGVACQAQSLTTFGPVPGSSKFRIAGTSTIHDWTMESPLIGGTMELDSSLVNEPSKATPGKVNAKVNANIRVKAFKSGNNAMDVRMQEAMNVQKHPQIEYRLTELNLKEVPKDASSPMQFDSKGELAVNGVTNKVAFPVTITRVDKDKLKVSGSTSVKMTDYKIEPPAPKIALGMIKTGDEVKLTFDWVTAKAAEGTASK